MAISLDCALLDWLVGPPDDLVLADYLGAVEGVLGEKPAPEAFAAKFEEIRTALRALPDPEINSALLQLDDWLAFAKRTKGLRLFPARRTADAWLFHELYRQQGAETERSGLEVAAALGSARATAHRSKPIHAAHHQGFEKRLGQTLYADTLRAAALLLDETGPLYGLGEPAKDCIVSAPFMRSDAWKDRLLATGLCQWAGLRHAFALHAKSSACMACAARDQAGVVEPAPRYFAALARLTRTLRARCEAAGAFSAGDPRAWLPTLLPALEGLLDGVWPDGPDNEVLEQHEDFVNRLFGEEEEEEEEETKEGEALLRARIERLKAWIAGTGTLTDEDRRLLERGSLTLAWSYLGLFAEMLDTMQDIAEREVRGDTLTAADHEFIRSYGKESAFLQFFSGNSYMSPRRQMGLVIDVASNPERGTILEVGIGAPMELYLVLPDEKAGQRLYVGAVHSYHEFLSSERLTDQAWRRRVTARSTPPAPKWTGSYIAAIDPTAYVRRIRAGEVVKEVKEIHDQGVRQALMDVLKSQAHETRHDDERIYWAADRLRAYADSPFHEAIYNLILDRLLHAPSHVRGLDGRANESSMAARGPRVLAAIARANEIERLFDLLESPPTGSSPETRERLRRVLVRARGDSIAPMAVARLRHEDPAIRQEMIAILASDLRGEKKAQAQAWIIGALAHETNDSNVLAGLEAMGWRVDALTEREALIITRLLKSESEAVQREAAKMLGRAKAATAARELLRLARSGLSPMVQAAALEALGVVLRGSMDAELVLEATRTVMRLHGSARTWRLHTATRNALGSLGGTAAAAALFADATDEDMDIRLRCVAIRELGNVGEPAREYLYRLLWDDTESWNEADDRNLRLSEDAVSALQALDFRQGDQEAWMELEDLEMRDPADRDAAVAAYRKKARAAGYGPKPAPLNGRR